MDACVPLESSSCTLCRVLGCFEIDTGVAMTFSGLSISISVLLSISLLILFSFSSHSLLFSFSCATNLSSIIFSSSHPQNLAAYGIAFCQLHCVNNGMDAPVAARLGCSLGECAADFDGFDRCVVRHSESLVRPRA